MRGEIGWELQKGSLSWLLRHRGGPELGGGLICPQGGSTWATVARSSHGGSVPTRHWGGGGVAVSWQRWSGACIEESCPLGVRAELASTSPQRRRAHAEVACSLSVWRSGGGRSWGGAEAARRWTNG